MRRGYLCHGCGLLYERLGDARACAYHDRQARKRRWQRWPMGDRPPAPVQYRGWGWQRR
jgi:hypothetical protein